MVQYIQRGGEERDEKFNPHYSRGVHDMKQSALNNPEHLDCKSAR